MIGRLRGRAAFVRLARHGARVRTRSLWCRFCPEPTGNLLVGFAFGRSTGTSVARNRVRRRVREALRTLDRNGLAMSGTMVIGATGPHVVDRSFEELRLELSDLLQRARGASGAVDEPSRPRSASGR